MRRVRWVCLGLLAALCWGGRASATPPTDPVDPAQPVESVAPTTTLAPGELPPALGPLVVVPSGCFSPAPARAVFVGRLANTDQPPTTARFRLERLLAGSLEGFIAANLVDVHYGQEAHFLTLGTRYVVGAAVDAATGVLVSTVREATPLFGGDAVIGANDSDVDCPRVEDPIRTLYADGTSVDTGVLTPLKGEGASLVWAVVRPLSIAFVVLVLLVILKHSIFGVGRALRDVSRVGPPAPKARPSRRHLSASGVADQPGP